MLCQLSSERFSNEIGRSNRIITLGSFAEGKHHIIPWILLHCFMIGQFCAHTCNSVWQTYQLLDTFPGWLDVETSWLIGCGHLLADWMWRPPGWLALETASLSEPSLMNLALKKAGLLLGVSLTVAWKHSLHMHSIYLCCTAHNISLCCSAHNISLLRCT